MLLSDWREASIDLEHGWLIAAGSIVRADVEINEDDLRCWLEKPMPKPTRLRKQPKRELAEQAVAALWPDGVPGQGTLPNKRLVERVKGYLHKNDMHASISDDTILRAAGRKASKAMP
jgi:predicted DNA-binding transcriptional regulator AlpA